MIVSSKHADESVGAVNINQSEPYDFRREDVKIPELNAAAQEAIRARATSDAARLPSVSGEPMATAGAAMSRDSVTLHGEVGDEKI